MNKIFLSTILFLLLFSSCTKRLYYLQDAVADKTSAGSEYLEHDIDYRITEYDLLKINIKSANPEISSYFNSLYGTIGNNQDVSQNTQMLSQSGSGAAGNFYFSAYAVTDSGYIDLPIIGLAKVAGKTIPEATKYIQELADEYLEDAYVMVKFVSFKITFMGEFNTTGTQVFFQEKLNIFEAIEQAGGISDYGNRQQVLVIRQTEEGRKTFYVNLQDRNILASEDLFLLPNDMIYVKPLGWRIFKVSSQDFLYVLTTISTLLTTTLLIISLGK